MRACIISVRGEWMRLRALWRSQLGRSLPAALGIVCELLALVPMQRIARGQTWVSMRDACFPSLVAHSHINLTFRDAFQALCSMRGTLSILGACALACSAPIHAQEAKITASNADNGDSFGWGVAIDGDTMVVGSRSEDSATTGINGDETDNSADRAGAAYVFRWDGLNWIQQAYLKASNAEALDVFGTSVDISGDTIVVGAPFEDSAATDVNGNQTDNSALRAGAAYVFVREGGVWTQEAYLKAANAEEGDGFGAKVAIYGDIIVVGAPGEAGIDPRGNDSGAAYVFERVDGIWQQTAYLKGFSDPDSFDFGADDLFGTAVDIADETIVVGAFGDDSLASGVNGDPSPNVASNVGAAYVFVRDGGGAWVQQAYLKASNPEEDDAFGGEVAVHADTIAIAASGEDSSATGIDGDETDNSSPDSGAVYVFRRDGITWSQEAYVKASNTESEDRFGNSVALHDGTMLVGATGEDSRARGIDGDQTDNAFSDSGAAYLFVRPDAAWFQKSYVKSLTTSSNDRFGFLTAVSNDIAVVSEPLADLGFGLDNAGAVYAYRILRPFVTDLAINPPDPVEGDMVTFSGVARLPAALVANLTNAEYRQDQGDWQPMQAADGLFDGDMEAIEAIIDGADLSIGSHELCARAFDDQGNVSIPACLTVGEICDNGIDDDGDGLIDGNDEEDCPSSGIGLAVACLHDPIYPMTEGDAIEINARALDGDGNPVRADVIEIWWTAADTIATKPALAEKNAETASFTFSPIGEGAIIYSCYASREVGTVREIRFSGWRLVDIGAPDNPDFPAIPVLLNGGLSRNIDIVFFPDEDEYPGGHLDPGFHQDVYDLINEGLYTIPWFVEFQAFFNFHLGRTTANSGPDPDDDDPSDDIDCLREAPDLSPWQEFGRIRGYKSVFSFADAGAIVHTSECRDNAGSPGMFTIEAKRNLLQIIAHEMGHRPFGLSDEYCCDGGYQSRGLFGPPFHNLFRNESGCRTNAADRGYDPDACRELFASGRNWWLFEPDFVIPNDRTSEIGDVMQNTGREKCGFDSNQTCRALRVGISEVDRLHWMLDECLDDKC